MIILFVGKFSNYHSLSIININLVNELQKYFDVYVKPLESDYSQQFPVFKNDIIPDIEIRHYYPPTWEPPIHSCTKLWYVSEWEFERVPIEWILNFRTLADKIIVPSLWLKNIYIKSGLHPNKINVIPNGYNPNIFFQSERKFKEQPLRFLWIGCTQYRKGLDLLIKSWESCMKHTNSELIIKDNPHIYGKKNINYTCKNIKIIQESLSEKQMGDLYRLCDIYICTSRGEAFCMPICEALACGLSVICPMYGPYSEIVMDANFLKCNIQKINPYDVFIGKYGDAFTLMGSHFIIYEPDLNDLKLKLQQNNPTKKFQIFKWEDVGKKYYNIINEH